MTLIDMRPLDSPLLPSASLAAAIKTNRRNVIMLGVAFFFVFASFNSSQNLVTTLLPEGYGFVSLCIIYATVCATKALAPLILNHVRGSWAMGGAALFYAAYVGSLISLDQWAIYVCSALLGAGASVLWTAQGAYLTSLSTDQMRSENAGLFWSIFSVSGIVGNLISFVYLHFFPDSDQRYLMGGFTAIGLVGAVLLALLRKPTPMVTDDGTDALDALKMADGVPTSIQTPLRGGGDDEKPLAGLGGLLSLLRKRQFWLLLPLNLLVGAELSFNVGAFPTLLPDRTFIGLVMMCTGVASVIGGALWGRASTKMDRRIVLTIGVFVYMAGLIAAWLFHMAVVGEFPEFAPAVPYVPYVIAFALALGDTCFNVNYIGTTGTAFDKRHATMAFAAFQFFQSAGAASVFLLGHFFPVAGVGGSLVVPITVGAVALVALVAFMFAPLTVVPQKR